jgi:hypothetical protein
MTKFVISKEVPEELSSYEMRIDPPNLLQEVLNCWNYRSANSITGVNWLRQIANEITKWDKSFNPYRHMVPSEHQGIPYSSPEDVAAIALRMVNERYPNLTDAWVEHCVKYKPPFTKLIWFTGEFKQTSKFTSNFIDRIELSEVDEYMGRHAVKKPNGMPLGKSNLPLKSSDVKVKLQKTKDEPTPSSDE